MAASVLLLCGLLFVLPGIAGVAHAEVSPRTAAVLAGWPDGASGSVAITELGSDAVRAYHVTRRGSRLTIFDRADRRYRTYYLSQHGTVVIVWDPEAARRMPYVVRGGGVVVNLRALRAESDRRFAVRSAVGSISAAAPPRLARRRGAVRAAAGARRLRSRLRALDRTLADVARHLTPIDAAVVSIVTDP